MGERKFISTVVMAGDYYRVFDRRGKKVVETHMLTVGELLGVGKDFILCKKGGYFITYNKWFERLQQGLKMSLGSLAQVTDSSLIFEQNGHRFAYDKLFHAIPPSKN